MKFWQTIEKIITLLYLTIFTPIIVLSNMTDIFRYDVIWMLNWLNEFVKPLSSFSLLDNIEFFLFLIFITMYVFAIFFPLMIILLGAATLGKRFNILEYNR